MSPCSLLEIRRNDVFAPNISTRKAPAGSFAVLSLPRVLGKPQVLYPGTKHPKIGITHLPRKNTPRLSPLSHGDSPSQPPQTSRHLPSASLPTTSCALTTPPSGALVKTSPKTGITTPPSNSLGRGGTIEPSRCKLCKRTSTQRTLPDVPLECSSGPTAFGMLNQRGPHSGRGRTRWCITAPETSSSGCARPLHGRACELRHRPLRYVAIVLLQRCVACALDVGARQQEPTCGSHAGRRTSVAFLPIGSSNRNAAQVTAL